MFKEDVLEILHDIGIYVEQIEMDYTIGDLIEDSLSFISFFIELESKYNIEFNENFFAEKTYDMELFKLKEIVENLQEEQREEAGLNEVLAG